MSDSLSRRAALRGLVGAGLAAFSGCMQAFPGSNGDVVVINEDDTAYEVTVTIDRGESHDTDSGSVTVDAGATGRVPNLLPSSDHPYPFYLHVELDGEYAGTTEHEGYDDKAITITGDREIRAADPAEAMTDSPSNWNETTAGSE